MLHGMGVRRVFVHPSVYIYMCVRVAYTHGPIRAPNQPPLPPPPPKSQVRLSRNPASALADVLDGAARSFHGVLMESDFPVMSGMEAAIKFRALPLTCVSLSRLLSFCMCMCVWLYGGYMVGEVYKSRRPTVLT